MPAVNVFDARLRDARAVAPRGEVRVRADAYARVRITVHTDLPRGVRQQAAVDHAASRFAMSLPTATGHREDRDGRSHAQNDFEYSGFQRFGALTDIVFEPEGEDLL